MAAFTYTPDKNPDVEYANDVNRSPFGDGYVQRVPNGINYIKEMWNLNFTLRTKTEVLAIRDFLKANGVVGFTWTTPFGDNLKFICTEYRAMIEHDTDASISAKFEQVFE